MRILDYLNRFIDYAVKGVRKQVNGLSYTKGTIANYKNLRQTIERFEKDTRTLLNWNEVNKDTYSKFIHWQERQGFSINYIGKHIKDLKSLMRSAYEDGIHANTVFMARWFTVPKEQTEKLPLTEEEINCLFMMDLEEGKTKCKENNIILLSRQQKN